MRCKKHATRPARAALQRAHTLLLEALLALSLGVPIAFGALALYRAQRDDFMQQSDLLRIAESAGAARDILAFNARLSGFDLDVLADEAQRAGTAALSPDWPALPTSGTHLPPVFGCRAGEPVDKRGEFTCVPARADSDGVAFRFHADPVGTRIVQESNDSGGRQASDCLSNGVGAEHKRVVNRFYVSSGKGKGDFLRAIHLAPKSRMLKF